MYIPKDNEILLPLPPSDIDECLQRSNICGLGQCTNNDNGTFYECDCPFGTVSFGTNSNGTLTCVGRQYSSLFHAFQPILSAFSKT